MPNNASTDVDIDAQQSIKPINIREYLKDLNAVNEIICKLVDNCSGDLVGGGSFGTVKRHGLSNGQEIAVKIMDLTTCRDSRTGGRQVSNRLIAEYEILVDVKHPFIVECYAFHLDLQRELLCLFMEYCEEKSLEVAANQFAHEEIPTLFAQICVAVAVLHNMNIIHRDLRPENILLTRSHVIRISDFGTAKTLDIQMSTTGTITGTPLYMAPELYEAWKNMIQHRPCEVMYRNDVDIWSLGCVLYFLAVRKHAFSIDEDTYERMAEQLPNKSHITTPFINLFNRLMEVNPEHRLKIDSVLEDEYLSAARDHLKQRFPQLNEDYVESSDSLEYVPRMVTVDNVDDHYWTRMEPLQTYSDGRSSKIDFSVFPMNDPSFGWVFTLWRKMVTGDFTESQRLYLPPLRLPSNGDFGGYIVDLCFMRRFTNSRPSDDLRVIARYASSPRNQNIPPPIQYLCRMTIQCSDIVSKKPLSDVKLRSWDTSVSWFIFQSFEWNKMDAGKPPSVFISFSSPLKPRQ